MALAEEFKMFDIRYDDKIGKAFRKLSKVINEYFPEIIDDYIASYYWGSNAKNVLNTIIKIIHNYDMICVADDDATDKNGIIRYTEYLDKDVINALNDVKKAIINENKKV